MSAILTVHSVSPTPGEPPRPWPYTRRSLCSFLPVSGRHSHRMHRILSLGFHRIASLHRNAVIFYLKVERFHRTRKCPSGDVIGDAFGESPNLLIGQMNCRLRPVETGALEEVILFRGFFPSGRRHLSRVGDVVGSIHRCSKISFNR
jgi:hypothetical protein